MTDRDATTTALRQRLTDLLAEWGAEMSAVITELERARQQLAAADEQAARHDRAVAEAASLRAELEARKSMIKSLRADAERARILQSRLEEQRRLVQQLESTVNRHTDTIIELKRTAAAWKQKYRALNEPSVASSTPAEPRASTDATSHFGVRPLPPVPESLTTADVAGVPDRTIAIDMRYALLEARRTAQGEK